MLLKYTILFKKIVLTLSKNPLQIATFCTYLHNEIIGKSVLEIQSGWKCSNAINLELLLMVIYVIEVLLEMLYSYRKVCRMQILHNRYVCSTYTRNRNAY